MYRFHGIPNSMLKWCVTVALVANLFKCSADYTMRTRKSGVVTISTVLTPAFARMRGSGSENSDYNGFIPELLKALNDRKGIPAYHIVKAPDNIIGQRQLNGNWTGLMGDVITSTPDSRVIGAGPILDDITYRKHVALSAPWASVELTLVVKNTSNVTSLQEALDRQMVILAVSGSPELDKVRTNGVGNMELANLHQRINQTHRYVETVEEGLRYVAREYNSGLLMNSEEARYYVTHDFCSLAPVKNFHELGKYVFVLKADDLALESLNEQLRKMKDDNSLDRLREKELGIPGTCSEGSAIHVEKISAVLLLTATVMSAQILS